MASRSYTKPIDRSNIRTVTIRRGATGSRIVRDRPATKEEQDKVIVKASEAAGEDLSGDPLIKQTVTFEANFGAAIRQGQEVSVEGERVSTGGRTAFAREETIGASGRDLRQEYPIMYLTGVGKREGIQGILDELSPTPRNVKQAARNKALVLQETFKSGLGLIREPEVTFNPPKRSIAANNPIVKEAAETVLKNPALTALGITGPQYALNTAVGATSFGTSLGVTKLALSTASATGIALGTAFTTETAIKATTTTPLERELLVNPKVKSAFASTITRQSQKQNNFVSQAAFGLSILADKDLETFRSIGRDELEKRGIVGSEQDVAIRALERQRFAAGTGEVFGLLAASSAVEIFGRSSQFGAQRFFSSKFGGADTFAKGFGRTFKPISEVGFAEGFAGELTQQFSRGEQKNIGKSIAVGALGAASAGIIGGTIGGLQTIGATGRRVFVERIADVLDPFEAPGDVTADIVKFAGKNSGLYVPVTTFTSGGTPTSSNTFTSSQTKTQAQVQTQTELTSTPTPRISLDIIQNFNQFTSTDTKIIPDTTKPNLDVIKPTPPPPTILSPVPTSTRTRNIFVSPTQTNVITQSNVVTFTPQNFVLPPILPSGGGGFGGLFGSRVSRKKKKVGTPSTLIGQTFGIGERTKKGKLYTGLEIRR